MTDYTDLIARLREDDPATWPPTDEAADALKAQARRISELESMIAVHRLAVDVDALKARIAELTALLSQTNEGYAECIATREDYRARIAELEAALKPMTAVVEFLLPFGDLSDEERAQWGEIIRAALGEKE